MSIAFCILFIFMTPKNNLAHFVKIGKYVQTYGLMFYSLATCGQDWARGEH